MLSVTLTAHAADRTTVIQAASKRVGILARMHPHLMHFDLASVGGAKRQKYLATVNGPLTDSGLIAILSKTPLIAFANSTSGPWRLTIVGDSQFARVTATPLPSCKGESARQKDWLLASTPRGWSVISTLPYLDIVCEPPSPMVY